MESERLVKTQIGETIRHYADMRFKQLTLLMAGVPVLAAGVVVKGYSTTKILGCLELRGVVPILGMMFTAVVWVMEVRSTAYFFAARANAKEVCPSPKFNRFHRLNVLLHRYINASTAVLVLYVSLYMAWWYCAKLWYPGKVLLVLFAVAGLVLLVFSFTTYWGAWEGQED